MLALKAHTFTTAEPKLGAELLGSNKGELANRTLVFMTSRGGTHKPEYYDMLRHVYKLKITHVTPTTHVASNSYRADLDDYRRIFELDEEQSEVLLEWLAAWSVVRLCCGTQMSDAWRTHLVPGARVAPSSFSGKSASSSSSSCKELLLWGEGGGHWRGRRAGGCIEK